jgi:hypothetical protein
MLLRAQEIEYLEEPAHRRVDDDMLGEGVAMEAAWPWALFVAGLAVAIGLFFVYTPR